MQAASETPGPDYNYAAAKRAKLVPLGSLAVGASFTSEQFPEGRVQGTVLYNADDDELVTVMIIGEEELGAWPADVQVQP